MWCRLISICRARMHVSFCMEMVIAMVAMPWTKQASPMLRKEKEGGVRSLQSRPVFWWHEEPGARKCWRNEQARRHDEVRFVDLSKVKCFFISWRSHPCVLPFLFHILRRAETPSYTLFPFLPIFAPISSYRSVDSCNSLHPCPPAGRHRKWYPSVPFWFFRSVGPFVRPSIQVTFLFLDLFASVPFLLSSSSSSSLVLLFR